MEIVNKILNWFRKTPRYPNYASGVIFDETPDYRNVELGAIQTQTPAPKSSSGLSVILKSLGNYDQKQLGICVPSSIFKLAQAYFYRKTGKIIAFNPRYLYRLCKVFDGIDGQGTIPRVGALLAVKYGIGTDKLPDNSTVSHEEYLNFRVTKEIAEDGRQYRLPGFAFVNVDEESIKRAIDQNGAVLAATLVNNWNKLPLSFSGGITWHYTIWDSYETVEGQTKFFNHNSWGSGWLAWIKSWFFPGRGYFYWKDVKDSVRDVIAFAEIPDNYLNKVKKMPYKFTQELKLGSRGSEVMELQKMLNEDPETAIGLEGPGSIEQETLYFGDATQNALIRWQVKNNITPSLGYFGPKSIKKINERITPKGMIEAWALAIQEFEGFSPGSKSWRNKNPGNIRYTPGTIFAQMATGQDQTGFCIFKDYNTGFEALKTLLVRACTGLSSVYSPDMTLEAFYHKYAPESDNNPTTRYAQYVAKKLGVSTSIKIKELL